MEYKEIVKNINKNAKIPFQNKPQYAKLIEKHLSIAVVKGGWKNHQYIAQALMDKLYKLHMGDMLKSTWQNTLKIKCSINCAIKAN